MSTICDFGTAPVQARDGFQSVGWVEGTDDQVLLQFESDSVRLVRGPSFGDGRFQYCVMVRAGVLDDGLTIEAIDEHTKAVQLVADDLAKASSSELARPKNGNDLSSLARAADSLAVHAARLAALADARAGAGYGDRSLDAIAAICARRVAAANRKNHSGDWRSFRPGQK